MINEVKTFCQLLQAGVRPSKDAYEFWTANIKGPEKPVEGHKKSSTPNLKQVAESEREKFLLAWIFVLVLKTESGYVSRLVWNSWSQGMLPAQVLDQPGPPLRGLIFLFFHRLDDALGRVICFGQSADSNVGSCLGNLHRSSEFHLGISTPVGVDN